MKRSTLRWIIGLMGVAMIGLISFQLYWIQSMFSENEERFRKDVIESLNAVADKLEKQETLAAYQKLSYLNSSVHNQIPSQKKFRQPSRFDFRKQGNTQNFVMTDTFSLDENTQFVVNFSSQSGPFKIRALIFLYQFIF